MQSRNPHRLFAKIAFVSGNANFNQLGHGIDRVKGLEGVFSSGRFAMVFTSPVPRLNLPLTCVGARWLRE
jgi:hypothetical protein